MTLFICIKVITFLKTSQWVCVRICILFFFSKVDFSPHTIQCWPRSTAPRDEEDISKVESFPQRKKELKFHSLWEGKFEKRKVNEWRVKWLDARELMGQSFSKGDATVRPYWLEKKAGPRISSNRSYVYTKTGEPVLSWQVYQEDDEDSSNRERPRVGEEEGERVGEGGSRNLSQISAGKDNTLACCLDSITRGLIPVPSLSLLAPSLLFIFLSLFPLPPSLSFYVGFISNISIF